jgi:hypothetical protein
MGIGLRQPRGWPGLSGRGEISIFWTEVVQICQFHQTAIIRRYLTGKPGPSAAIESKEIVNLMTVNGLKNTSFFHTL